MCKLMFSFPPTLFHSVICLSSPISTCYSDDDIYHVYVVCQCVAGTHSHMCHHLYFGSWGNRVMAIACSDADRIWRLCVCVWDEARYGWPITVQCRRGQPSPLSLLMLSPQRPDRNLLPLGVITTALYNTHTQIHNNTHTHLLKTSQLLSKTIAMSLAHIVRSICWSMLTFFQAIKNSSVRTLSSGIIGPL